MSLRYLFILTIICFSCNKDDNTNENPVDGLINGKSFEISSARYTMHNGDQLLIEAFGEINDSALICREEPRGLRLKFIAQNDTDRQELFIDTDIFEAFTIEMIDPALSNSIIASQGYFDIIEMDNQGFRAKIDITVDENSYVKREFEASFCN